MQLISISAEVKKEKAKLQSAHDLLHSFTNPTQTPGLAVFLKLSVVYVCLVE
jgi:hypothetical protein